MDALANLDIDLFLLINGFGHNNITDAILLFFRNKLSWIPLYILFIAYAIYTLKSKSILLLAFTIATVGIADMTSSHLIKKSVKRLRPCQQDEIRNQQVLLLECGSGYSMTSSHATNHAALAVFLILSFFKKRFVKGIAIFWFLTIGYAQIFCGLHYPFDILLGWILGISLAYISHGVYERFTKWIYPVV